LAAGLLEDRLGIRSRDGEAFGHGDLKPRGQLVEQLGVGARIDLALEDPGRTADRECRGPGGAVLRAPSARRAPPGHGALDEPRAFALRGLFAVSTISPARACAWCSIASARSRAPRTISSTRDSAAPGPSAAFGRRQAVAIRRVRSWIEPVISGHRNFMATQITRRR